MEDEAADEGREGGKAVNLFEKIILAIGAILIVLVVLFSPTKKIEAAQPVTTLLWTAPGDDSTSGRASTYYGRYRTVGITGTDTLGWWNAATVIPSMPVPSLAGVTDSVKVTMPGWATTYYFVMIACDDGLPGPGGSLTIAGPPNCSTWSNVATKTFGPEPDVTPPKRIIDLIAR